LNNFSRLSKVRILAPQELAFSFLQVQASTSVTPVDSLNKTRRHRYLLVAPLNSEHSPVFLDVNSGKSLFLSILFCLAFYVSQNLLTLEEHSTNQSPPYAVTAFSFRTRP